MQLWTEYEGATIDGAFPLNKLLLPEGRSAFFSTANGKGEPVVLRLIECHFDEEEILARWRSVDALAHPNFLRIDRYGKIELDGGPVVYAVFEKTDAVLAEVLEQGRLSVKDTVQLAASLVMALETLHENGFVHEHVEPRNIFAVGEVVKLRSDCIREAREGEAGAEAKRRDVQNMAVVVLQALTQRQSLEGVRQSELPPPFDGIVRYGMSGAWGLKEIRAALKGELRRTPGPPAEAVPTVTRVSLNQPVADRPIVDQSAAPVESAPPPPRLSINRPNVDQPVVDRPVVDRHGVDRPAAPATVPQPLPRVYVNRSAAPAPHPQPKPISISPPLPKADKVPRWGENIVRSRIRQNVWRSRGREDDENWLRSKWLGLSAMIKSLKARSRGDDMRSKWMGVAAMVAVVLVLAGGLLLRGSHRHKAGTAQTAPKIVVSPVPVVRHPAPARPAAGVPARTSQPRAVAHQDAGARTQWRVIVYTYNRQADAQKKADAIAEKRPDLRPDVFTPSGRAPYLVTIGGVMERDQAYSLARKARKLGLPRDAYAQNYSASQ